MDASALISNSSNGCMNRVFFIYFFDMPQWREYRVVPENSHGSVNQGYTCMNFGIKDFNKLMAKRTSLDFI